MSFNSMQFTLNMLLFLNSFFSQKPAISLAVRNTLMTTRSTLVCQQQNWTAFFSQKYHIALLKLPWPEMNQPDFFFFFWLRCWNNSFNAAEQEMSHLAFTKPFAVRLFATRRYFFFFCHSLIEWWLPWIDPPVFSLCENMLMQIDANDVVLYM